MSDEVVGADQEGALHLATEGVYRFVANNGGRRGEVDQIAVMDDERREIVAMTQVRELADLLGIRSFCAPHARARGEDLKRVRAEFVGFDGGALERAGG